VRSIDAFFPWGDRLVVDDGSSVSQAFGVLQEIGRRPNWRCQIMDRDPRQTFPGFYRNMGVALNYALEQGYDYCFFLEDDLQFVWKKDDYTSYIENVFDICPDAIQIRPRFIWRYLTHFTNIEYIAPARAYRTERGFETTAIWNLDTVRRHPDYHFICDWKGNPFASRSYLGANSAYWMRRGYRLYLQLDPAVASVRGIESRFFCYCPCCISAGHSNTVG